MNRFDYSDEARNEGLRRLSQLTWRTAGVAAAPPAPAPAPSPVHTVSGGS